MLVFSPQGHARFSYRVGFSQHPFANISFFDADRRRILFHLSLRQPEGLAVCNWRGLAKTDWGPEIAKPVHLPPGGVTGGTTVEIRFALPRVIVLLDGIEVFNFGTRLKRPRFSDLHKIAFVDCQGGIPPGAIDIDHAGDGALRLTSRLELRGRLQRPPPGALHLEIDDIADAPTLIVTPDGDTGKMGGKTGGLTLRAVLPGRIWDGLAHGTARKIRLCAGETVLAEMPLRHCDLLTHVRPALTLGDLGGDLFLATQILEHARFAGIMADLDPQAQMRLAGLADFLGLEPLSDLDTPPSIPADIAPPPDPTAREMTGALAEVAQSLHPGLDGTAPDLHNLLTTLSPPAGGDPALFYVALAEPFCQRDAFDLLYDHVRRSPDIAAQITPRDHPWYNSGLLPYLLRSGRIELLHKTLQSLVQETEPWLMTPPLAWTVRAALDNPVLADPDRDAILRSFLAFLAQRMTDYWQRTPCTQLIKAGVALIDAGPRLPDDLRRETETGLLRAFGLMPTFWACIANCQTPLPQTITATRDAFATLSDPKAGENDRSAALRLFERIGCPDTMQVRRDLFGPAGLPGNAPTPQALLQEGLAPAEPALRYMATPGFHPKGTAAESALQEAARTALPACYPTVAQAPQYALQSSASRRAVALLEQARAGDDPQQDCAALLLDLSALTNAGSHWIGAGIALGLLNGLIRAGAEAPANLLVAGLDVALTKAGGPQNARSWLSDQPALAMPVRALQSLADSGQDKARAALDTLGLTAPMLPRPTDLPDALADLGNPIFDTLVVVFSCRAHLNTRIPQMRAGWLSRLKELGVPYVIITGDRSGTDTEQMQGDVLHLDAPDNYEGLPQKTLAAIAWVHDHTAFSHMLKVDDDCFLNVDEYFHSQSHRKFDYYGRTLTRVEGQMDRAWHCAKSNSDRGRQEYDKSPEPSTYCDGGSGYALSRRAMAAALDAAASPLGQTLIQVSFMEDKLLGDLLALRDIRPQDEDYRITVRRRETPDSPPVPRWVNGFDASRTAPVKLVHLDTADAQEGAHRRVGQPGLWPKKIWPSYQPARLGEQSNALEMITAPDRLKAARDAPVAVVASMRNEMFMLPHFLAHYRRLGVESFLIADNCSDDGTLEFLAAQADVALFSVDTDYRHSHYGVAWQQALMANFRTDRWSLVADADELLTWETRQTGTLPNLLRTAAFDGADAARIFMLDMYPQGPLAQAGFASGDPFAEAGFTDHTPFLRNSFGRGPYSNAPTWTSAVRHRLIPGSRNELFVAQKIALLKYSAFLRPSAGLHYVAGARLAKRDLLFGHFKYNADFHRKARAEVARRQHFNNAEEYRKYLALLAEGRDVIYDPALSVPWADSEFVRARLAGIMA